MFTIQNPSQSQMIDVAINVYGKPWQTLVSLKSLLLTSGKHIDKIYFIEERNQPYNEDVRWVIQELNYQNTIHFRPDYHLGTTGTNKLKCLVDKNYRHSIRYQYALEVTDKKFMLLIHNDVLFESDIVGAFLNEIHDGFAIGQVGQCWNCPMYMEDICDGTKFGNVHFSYREAMHAAKKYPATRTYKSRNLIDRNITTVMPECRINEWCCLINMEIYRKSTQPFGTVWPFGGYFRLDVGDAWFRGMVKKGYHPVHYNIYQHMKHGCFVEYDSSIKNAQTYVHGSVTHAGHSALSDNERYYSEESAAKEIYKTLI